MDDGGGQKHIKITEAIIYFICKDNQPFSVVEDIEFKKLMKEVAPLYKVPTRNTIKARILQRWNSVYFMCKRFLELKELDLIQIVLKHINAPPMLNGQEIENIKEAVNILEILEKVTSEISGQKYATMSLVIPIISCINDNLSTMLPTSRIGVEFKIAITDEMKKRFKNIHFKDALALLKHLRFINNSINSLSSTVEEDHLSTDSSDSASEYGTIDLWGHHKNLARKSLKTYVDKTNLGNQKHLGPEITMYLSTPVSPLKTDPLITWEELKPMYPLIHKLATKYLSGVSTSVPSERLFSCASNTFMGTRIKYK
ncbi:hypothetical protein ACI65C_004424 [Semiaphis heraclei]